MKAFRRILIVFGILLLVIALVGYIITCYLASNSGMTNRQVRTLASLGNEVTNYGMPMDSESRVVVWFIVSQSDALLFGIISVLTSCILIAVEKSGMQRGARRTEPQNVPPLADASMLKAKQLKRQQAEQRVQALKQGVNKMAAQVHSDVDKAVIVAKHGAKRGAYHLSKKLTQFAGEDMVNDAQVPEEGVFKSEQVVQAKPIVESPDDYEKTLSIDSLLGATVDIAVNDGKQATFNTTHITSDPFVIGRGDTCNIVIDNISVSRKHCILSCKQGRLLVQNQSTVNPAKLNGRDIGGEDELSKGDTLLLGLAKVEIIDIRYDKAIGMLDDGSFG